MGGVKDAEKEDKDELLEEEETASMVTLILEPVPQVLDVSQASSEGREGSSGEWSHFVTHTGPGFTGVEGLRYDRHLACSAWTLCCPPCM